MSAVDQEQLDAAVEAAVTEILEVSAFDLAERVDAGEVPAAAITAALAFHGPPSGVLRMWIEPAQARAVTAALLGDGDHDPSLIADTVAELANMIAGHVLSRMFADVCVAIERAAVGGAAAGPYPLQLAGGAGRIGLALELAP